MIRSLALCSLVAIAACGSSLDAIQFIEPDIVVVRSGDSLHAIATAHGVALEELESWNGMGRSDALVPGSKLVVFQLPVTPSSVSVAEVPEAPAPRRVARSSGGVRLVGTSRARSRSRSSTAPILRVEPAVVVVPRQEPAARPRGARIEADGAPVGSSGILRALANDEVDLGGIDDDLAASVSELSRQRSGVSGTAMQRSDALASVGTADSLDHVREAKEYNPLAGVGSARIRPPSLPRPRAKRCLSGPRESDLKQEDGYLSSQGLTASQISQSMSRIVRYTTQCIPSDSRGEFELVAEIDVGCDGRVTNVWVINSGGLPANVTACIAKTIEFTAFPAHALPNGMAFQFPIQYRF